MTLPSVQDLYQVTDKSWPPAQQSANGVWIIREGQGGGSRVSSATANGPITQADLPVAEQAMRALGQVPQFMIRHGDDDLDQLLATAGYQIKDPVNLYVAPVSDIALTPIPPVTSFEVWPPLAAQAEIWAEGGIGPTRLAVMERAPQPKTTFLGRIDDTPAGTAYVGSHLGVAMIHAIEITPDQRRKGLARHLITGAAFWAQRAGLSHVSLVCTQANLAANALYASMGFTRVGQYHYRILPEDT